MHDKLTKIFKTPPTNLVQNWLFLFCKLSQNKKNVQRKLTKLCRLAIAGSCVKHYGLRESN